MMTTGDALSVVGTLLQVLTATYLLLAGFRIFRRRGTSGQVEAGPTDVMTGLALACGILVIFGLLVVLLLVAVRGVEGPANPTGVLLPPLWWAVGIAGAWEAAALYGVGAFTMRGMQVWLETSERKYPFIGALTGRTDEELDGRTEAHD